jgi:peptidoglycan/xylan/chitin deacetylase (PgdA/CDA1 family)
MKTNYTKEQKETLKLVGILSVCVFILLVLSIVFMNSCDVPTSSTQAKQPVAIDNLEGMSLSQAESMLKQADITYEIIPTDSRTPNKVEKFEYVGKVENGKIYIEAGTNVKIYTNKVSKDKIVYLTFDDGPTRDNTNEIVVKLREYGIKASFFVEGRDVERYPDRMETIFNDGHIIACHSHTHDFYTVYSSTDAFVAEIKQYENALLEAIGEENYAKIKKILRFPGGTNNAYIESNEEALEYINAARELGYSVYDWTALTGDAEGNSDAQSFIATLESGLTKSKNNDLDLIILMHDKWSTNEALGEILDYLISEGYYFDTIDNCPEYTFIEH